MVKIVSQQEASGRSDLAKLAVKNLVGLLERDRQKVHPIRFQVFPSIYKSFLRLLIRRISKINPKNLGNVSSDVPGQGFREYLI